MTATAATAAAATTAATAAATAAAMQLAAAAAGALAAACLAIFLVERLAAVNRRHRFARVFPPGLVPGPDMSVPKPSGGHRRRPRAAMWAICAAAGAAGAVLAGARGITGVLVAAAAGAAAVWAVQWAGAQRRRAAAARAAERFAEQLEGELATVAASLRAGLSLVQGLEVAAQEADPPLRDHLNAVLEGYGAGLPLDEALQILTGRVPSSDADYFVQAVRVGRAQGGDLAEALATIGETLRERRRLRGDLMARTADARLTVRLLAGLPLVMLPLAAIAQRDGLAALVQDPVGRAAALYAVVSWAAGVRLAQSMLEVKGLHWGTR